mgnify:CR=1 FL=1
MEIGAYEAKTHLPQILEKVKKGEQFIITKHGVPIAMLTPAEPVKKKYLKSVIEELKGFNKGYTTCGMTIKEMIEKGRR